MNKLQAHETRISLVVGSLKDRFKIKRNRLDRDWQRGQAVTALGYLDPLPDTIYEQIRALSTSKNMQVAASAKYVLQQCHEMSAVHPTSK